LNKHTRFLHQNYGKGFFPFWGHPVLGKHSTSEPYPQLPKWFFKNFKPTRAGERRDYSSNKTAEATVQMNKWQPVWDGQGPCENTPRLHCWTIGGTEMGGHEYSTLNHVPVVALCYLQSDRRPGCDEPSIFLAYSWPCPLSHQTIVINFPGSYSQAVI
jgi:hypothetical protein